jgi:hypothetical protein
MFPCPCIYNPYSHVKGKSNLTDAQQKYWTYIVTVNICSLQSYRTDTITRWFKYDRD